MLTDLTFPNWEQFDEMTGDPDGTIDEVWSYGLVEVSPSAEDGEDS